MIVHLDEPIKLKCSTDENVRMSSIKWYRNGHKINEENNSNLQVERVPSHDLIYSTLLIHRATLNDAGTYMCKFEKIHEKIHVDVVIGLKSGININFYFFKFQIFNESYVHYLIKDKSSVVRSNMENKKLVSSFSDSITAASNANQLTNLNYLIWITISSLLMLC